MKEQFASWLSDAGYGEIIRVEALTGGCINNTVRLHLDSGLSVILQYNASAPAELFRAEAAGLAALHGEPAEAFGFTEDN